MYSLSKRCIAETVGTFWLVFGGCGSAVLAALYTTQPENAGVQLGIGFVGVAFAFGLTVLTMATRSDTFQAATLTRLSL